MTTESEVADIIIRNETPHDRIVTFGALLARESRSEIIVVGGSAIEVYTRGGYLSGDIDVIGDPARIVPTLRTWGFVRSGRLWIRQDWKIAIDIVGKHYTGDVRRARTISTPHGPVRLAVPEDLLVKRLASAKHWNLKGDLEHAALLYAAERGNIDWDYAEHVAKERGVSDLLADFKRRVEAIPNDELRRETT